MPSFDREFTRLRYDHGGFNCDLLQTSFSSRWMQRQDKKKGSSKEEMEEKQLKAEARRQVSTPEYTGCRVFRLRHV